LINQNVQAEGQRGRGARAEGQRAGGRGAEAEGQRAEWGRGAGAEGQRGQGVDNQFHLFVPRVS